MIKILAIGIIVWFSFLLVKSFLLFFVKLFSNTENREGSMENFDGHMNIDGLKEIYQDFLDSKLNSITPSAASNRYSEENISLDIIKKILRDIYPTKLPRQKEYFNNWIRRGDIPLVLKEYGEYVYSQVRSKVIEIKKEDKIKKDKEEIERQELKIIELEKLFNDSELKQKFLEISYRKVKSLDEYGHQQRHKLDDEFKILVKKLPSVKLHDELSRYLKDSKRFTSLYENYGDKYGKPSDLKLLYQIVVKEFCLYEKERDSVIIDYGVVDKLSGVDFELYLIGILKTINATNVAGTKTSGDQGADILFELNGLKYVVQAKRWNNSVGNKAIQEVYSAVNFYNRDKGVVSTNSKFTSSAQELASKLGVILINGTDLNRLKDIL